MLQAWSDSWPVGKWNLSGVEANTWRNYVTEDFPLKEIQDTVPFLSQFPGYQDTQGPSNAGCRHDAVMHCVTTGMSGQGRRPEDSEGMSQTLLFK